MKKICLIGVIAGLMGWLGCGGDDDPVGPEPPTIITVTAATGLTAPARLSVDDTVWNRITPKSVPITADRFSSAGKSRPDNALAVASGVAVQAVVVNDTLYLRLEWIDATWDRWPGRYEVTELQVSGPDVLAIFTKDALSFSQDQAVVLFEKDVDNTWDVWRWQLVTTGGGYLAEGLSLSESVLTPDAGGAEVAMAHLDLFGQPVLMHTNGPDYTDHILPMTETVAMDHLLAWEIGDRVAGWLINVDLYRPQFIAERGSRFDVAAFSDYAPGTGHTVVLSRALSTGDEADLDMTSRSTVDVRIGITDNRDFLFNAGSTHQGFSNTFRLTLP